MKKVSKVISEIINVIKRHRMLIVSSLTALFLILFGLVKLVGIIITKVIEIIINIF
tara:strand:+ start:18 stop:185 length:168 start_codon:yes stop_codon:yes gene_type:complete